MVLGFGQQPLISPIKPAEIAQKRRPHRADRSWHLPTGDSKAYFQDIRQGTDFDTCYEHRRQVLHGLFDYSYYAQPVTASHLLPNHLQADMKLVAPTEASYAARMAHIRTRPVPDEVSARNPGTGFTGATGAIWPTHLEPPVFLRRAQLMRRLIARHPGWLALVAAFLLALALAILLIGLALLANPETWYFRTAEGAACGDGDRESLSESAGSSTATKVLDSTGATWNRTETTRSIGAGNWQVLFDATTGSGSGPTNKSHCSSGAEKLAMLGPARNY